MVFCIIIIIVIIIIIYGYIYISNFRKQRSGFIQLEVGGAHLDEPNAFANAFAQHFRSVYNNNCPIDFPPLSQSSEFLSLAPISD
jgi:hypothetical protein